MYRDKWNEFIDLTKFFLKIFGFIFIFVPVTAHLIISLLLALNFPFDAVCNIIQQYVDWVQFK